MIRFKDRFRDHCKARYNKIPGCGVLLIWSDSIVAIVEGEIVGGCGFLRGAVLRSAFFAELRILRGRKRVGKAKGQYPSGTGRGAQELKKQVGRPKVHRTS